MYLQSTDVDWSAAHHPGHQVSTFKMILSLCRYLYARENNAVTDELCSSSLLLRTRNQTHQSFQAAREEEFASKDTD